MNRLKKLGILVVLTSCSSVEKKSSGDREIAQERPQPAQDQRVPATLSGGLPWVPGMPAQNPSHMGKQPATQFGTKMEDYGGCKLGFAYVYLNNQRQNAFSVGDLMFNLSQNKITGVQEYDRLYLRQWFLGHKYDNAMMDMASGSKGFHAALELVQGPLTECSEGKPCHKFDYFARQRMAGILAMMRAVSHDPECVLFFKKWGLQILPGPENATQNVAFLNELPIEKALDHKKSGALVSEFQKLEAKRLTLEDQMLDLDKQIEVIEEQNKSEKTKLENKLFLSLKELENRFKKIPDCVRVISRQKTLTRLDPEATEKTLIDNLRTTCADAIKKKLDKISADQSRIILNRPEGDNNFETDLKLIGLETEGETLKKYLESLTDSTDPQSVAMQIEEIQIILNDKKELEAPAAVKKIKEQIELKKKEQTDLAPAWFTYGFLGGFDAGN